MSDTVDQIDPGELGARLGGARDSANLTQAAAAELAGLARTTLVAIEQGRRKIRIGELQALAKLYRTSANALLRVESVHVDLIPKYRKLADHTDPSVADAGELLTHLVQAEVELENLLGVSHARNYPPQRPICLATCDCRGSRPRRRSDNGSVLAAAPSRT